MCLYLWVLCGVCMYDWWAYCVPFCELFVSFIVIFVFPLICLRLCVVCGEREREGWIEYFSRKVYRAYVIRIRICISKLGNHVLRTEDIFRSQYIIRLSFMHLQCQISDNRFSFLVMRHVTFSSVSLSSFYFLSESLFVCHSRHLM